jgi:hypothetical protein
MNIQAALVFEILKKYRSYDWTVQGFGFIRTKIANVGRIHIWDSRLATSLVSTAHTHPWDLDSTIISGELINCRFGESNQYGIPYIKQSIATGEGGGLIDEPESVYLSYEPLEILLPYSEYHQDANEIHRTIAQDGTVTLLTRKQGPPLEKAIVYWPFGTTWVSAEPRPAQQWEVDQTIDYALRRWSA